MKTLKISGLFTGPLFEFIGGGQKTMFLGAF